MNKISEKLFKLKIKVVAWDYAQNQLLGRICEGNQESEWRIIIKVNQDNYATIEKLYRKTGANWQMDNSVIFLCEILEKHGNDGSPLSNVIVAQFPQNVKKELWITK